MIVNHLFYIPTVHGYVNVCWARPPSSALCMNMDRAESANPFAKTGLQRTPTKKVLAVQSDTSITRAGSESNLDKISENKNFILNVKVRKSDDQKVQIGLDRYLKRKMSPSNENAGNAAKKTNVIPLSNRFDALSTDNDETETVDTSSYKPAPIYLRQVNTPSVIDLVKQVTDSSNFLCRNIRRGNINETKVQCNTIDDYRKVVTALENKKMQFYTYRLKLLRGLTVVVKGIESGVEPELIKDALNGQGFEVASVTNIINRFKQPQPLYRVELQPSARKLKPGEVHPIYKINRLINRVVTIEEPRKRTGPVQCHNCQEYGHTKGYCKLPAVCVACGGIHETKKCLLPKNEPEAKKCSNCGGNHTANYRGCPVFISLKKNPQNPRPKLVPNKPPPRQGNTGTAENVLAFPRQSTGTAPTTSSFTSYRDALLNQSTPPTNPPADQLQIFMSSMMQLMTSMQTMMQEMLHSQQLLIQKLQSSK